MYCCISELFVSYLDLDGKLLVILLDKPVQLWYFLFQPFDNSLLAKAAVLRMMMLGGVLWLCNFLADLHVSINKLVFLS